MERISEFAGLPKKPRTVAKRREEKRELVKKAEPRDLRCSSIPSTTYQILSDKHGR
jgi:hypothetical protein